MKYFSVNLNQYYNHIIFDKPGLNEKNEYLTNHLLGVAGYYLTKEEYINFLEYNNEIKQFETNFDGLYDNIMCDGQTITIEQSLIRGISFLGFCEFGTVKESFYYNHSIAGSFILKTFHTDNWQSIETSEDNIMCQSYIHLFGNDAQKHNIYSYSYIMNENTKINSIILPYNLSMHIIAISLIQ